MLLDFAILMAFELNTDQLNIFLKAVRLLPKRLSQMILHRFPQKSLNQLLYMQSSKSIGIGMPQVIHCINKNKTIKQVSELMPSFNLPEVIKCKTRLIKKYLLSAMIFVIF